MFKFIKNLGADESALRDLPPLQQSQATFFCFRVSVSTETFCNFFLEYHQVPWQSGHWLSKTCFKFLTDKKAPTTHTHTGAYTN